MSAFKSLPFAEFQQFSQTRVDQYLESVFPNSSPFGTELYNAMRYSVFNGGKRVRPLLVYATAIALDCALEKVDPVAAAIELMHAYSLVHDDLPAMDDDDLRRGKPTCHKAFDEATAILAGDALQTLAFEHLAATDRLPTDTRAQLILLLAKSAGAQGMVMGQAIDLASVDKVISLTDLEQMHRYKTGAIIRACVESAAKCSASVTTAQQQHLLTYAAAVGLAFQVQDDILDIESDTATLGKQQGADLRLNKPTYPALLGLDGAKQKVQELHAEAIAALTLFGERANHLRDLAHYIVQRKN